VQGHASGGESGWTRRQFVAAAGAVATASAGVATTSGTAAAQDEYEWTELPDSATVDFDEAALTNYQPYLVQSQEAKRRTRAMFGYRVRYDDPETPDCYCYWTRYSMQDLESGPLSFLGRRQGIFAPDAHHEDHEPTYVFVDSGTGEVVDAVAPGYHWYAMDCGPALADTTYLERQVSGEKTHVNLRVVDPWHHMQRNTEFEGRRLQLKNFVTARPNWIDNGFYDPVNVTAVENPWVMDRLNSWWDKSRRDDDLAWIRYTFGIQGADRAGDIRPSPGWA
jgi:hypothetical protein